MPRLWIPENPEENWPMDFCRSCWEEALETYPNADPDDFPYGDWPGEYTCADCGEELGARDAKEPPLKMPDRDEAEWERRQLYGGRY